MIDLNFFFFYSSSLECFMLLLTQLTTCFWLGGGQLTGKQQITFYYIDSNVIPGKTSLLKVGNEFCLRLYYASLTLWNAFWHYYILAYSGCCPFLGCYCHKVLAVAHFDLLQVSVVVGNLLGILTKLLI